MRRTIFLCAVLALTGCQSTPGQDADPIIRAAVTQFQQCWSTAYNLPEVETLHRHRPLDLRDATLEQLSDKSKVTPEDIRALNILHTKIQECRRPYIQVYDEVAPSLASLYESIWQKYDESLIDLIQRKISWSEYLKQSKQTTTDGKERFEAIRQELAARYQQQQAAMAQQKLNALALFQATRPQPQPVQQYMMPTNPTVTTNCFSNGAYTNCTSR
jgi:hypothetical protein